MPFKDFLRGRFKSFRCAIRGMILLIKHEVNIQIQLCIGLLVTLAGFIVEISPYEFLVQTLTIGLILGLEGLNTALEHLADFVHPGQHQQIGRIKDMAAGAVLIAAATAVIIGLLIYIPKLF